MLSIDLIRENLIQSESLVLARIEEMREHCLVFPTSRGGCHTLWLLGHLAYIECLVVRSYMLGESNPLAEWESVFDSSEVSGNEEHYPPFDQVLQECRQVRAATIVLANSLTEEDLDNLPKNLPNAQDMTEVVKLFGTYRRCLQYTCNHWFMHRGQLADARRAAGIERMWY